MSIILNCDSEDEILKVEEPIALFYAPEITGKESRIIIPHVDNTKLQQKS